MGVTIRLNKSVRYQEIFGFGGAFTDAAGINIAKLSQDAQTKLIESYYSDIGSEYNVGRINIGGCDFSDRPYTYCDTEGDTNLDTFSLAQDDTLYKIPYILLAQEMSSKDLLMFGSAWSAPGWMKTNGLVYGQGQLLAEYYQLWADYHLKFLQAYEVSQSQPRLASHNLSSAGCRGPHVGTDCTE